jgi:hypothetical protein
MLLEAKQLPSLPLMPPLAQITQANPFLEKALMQETSCWQRQACQKQRSSWDCFLILEITNIPPPKQVNCLDDKHLQADCQKE